MSINRLVIYSFFTALNAVLSQISIPISFSHISMNLSLLSVFLCACFIGVNGAWSQLVYILLGVIGVPVFANFTSGIGHLLGPSGGFIISYPVICIVSGFILKKINVSFYKIIIALLIGLILCYLIGTVWFSYITKTQLKNSIIMCVVPFIALDVLKIVLSSYVYIKIKDKVRLYL